MTTISIFATTAPVTGKPRFEAVAGEHQAAGATLGKAIDALGAKLGPTVQRGFIVVQPMGGDEFFSDAKITGLQRKMDRWRRKRDAGETVDSRSSKELEDLVDEELEAAIKRSKAALTDK